MADEMATKTDEPEAAAPVHAPCESCGGPIVDQSACEQCFGEDPYGYPMFCPNCDFCCGC